MAQWLDVRLGDYIIINPESLSANNADGVIQYVDISSVEQGRLLGYTEYDIKDAPGRARRIMRKGDIIISTVRPNLKTYYYVNECPENAICSTGFAVLRPKNKVDGRFIYYLVSENSFTDWLTLVAKGSAYPAVDTIDFKKAKVSIPDYTTQTEISGILSAYDDLITVNNKRIKVLEQMAENLYKEWFVRFRFPGHETAEFENGIPKGWKPGYLREIMSFSSGKPKPNDGTAFPVYGGNGITDWCNSYSHENVIILGRVGAYCGSTYFETGKCWISDNALYRISKRNDFKSFFYDYMLLKTLNLNKFQGGTGQPLITQGLLSRIKCILPSNDMVYSYDSVVRPIFDLIRTIHSKNNNLVKQRDLLLPRLMSGKLEV